MLTALNIVLLFYTARTNGSVNFSEIGLHKCSRGFEECHKSCTFIDFRRKVQSDFSRNHARNIYVGLRR